MNESELRTQGKALRHAYYQLIECYTKEHINMTQELKELLSRGVYNGAFGNPEGILISGINPSYDNKEENDLPYNLLTECTGKYWKPYVEIANCFPENIAGYQNHPERIKKSGIETSSSNLIGSYLFITGFYQYAKNKITADDIQLLWNEYVL